MILSEIRTRVFEEMDWEPSQSSTVTARVDRMINRALQQMVLDAPYLFEAEWTITTQADWDPSVSTDTLSVYSSDPWVMSRDALTSVTGVTAWSTDRSWDGRMIMIVDSAGAKHFRRIRHIWQSGAQQYLTLDRPWVDTSATGMDYHIFTEAYSFDRKVSEVSTVQLSLAGDTSPLEWKTLKEVEDFGGRELPGTYATTSAPRACYTLPSFSLMAPNTAPVVDNAEQGNPWVGPRLAGTFQYKFTYCWGVQDYDQSYQGPTLSTVSATRRPRPRWESPSSPASAVATATNTGSYITVTTPDIEFDLGFSNSAAAAPRDGKSGIYKRIYERRLTENTTNPTSGAPTHHDIRDEYYLIAEISGDTDTYNVDGADIPDLDSPLNDDAAYKAFGLYPRPSGEMEINIRAVTVPDRLVSDGDAPPLPGLAVEALIHKALVFTYGRESNRAAAGEAQESYEHTMDKIQSRFGGGLDPNQPVTKRLSRARRARRGSRLHRRWWR